MALVLVLVLIASGAAFSGGAPPETGQPPVLRVKCVNWIARKAFVSQAADDFQATHPEITVKLELVVDKGNILPGATPTGPGTTALQLW